MTGFVQRYFELSTSPDREAYLALFADDVVVEDDGRTHVGLDAVRAWRADVPPVTYTVVDEQLDAGTSVVRADIDGDFPGSPVTLTFTFTFTDDGLISSLTIRP